MKQEEYRAELEALKQEVERLKTPKPSLLGGLAKSLHNTTKSPVSTLVSVAFSAPILYKGIVLNDTTMISMGIGLMSNGMLTSEKPPENQQPI